MDTSPLCRLRVIPKHIEELCIAELFDEEVLLGGSEEGFRAETVKRRAVSRELGVAIINALKDIQDIVFVGSKAHLDHDDGEL